jgi:hypothetical protein
MRVFFHLVDGSDSILDCEGVEVEGPSEIREAVVRDVSELFREFSAEDRHGWRLHVTDEAGALLLAIPLGGTAH